jgi:putative ABC transport system ATP-binding protein
MYIELNNITKSYQEGDKQHHILEGIHLGIPQGEFVALLGPSGSGKTTLLNLISGIDLPDQGEIIIDGEKINTLNDQQRTLFRRHQIGFVFQFFNLIPTLTVIENLQFPLELCGIMTADKIQELKQLLDSLGLKDKAYRYPEQLSGGEQQRIAIARAMIHHPKLLLADEPTGNLDDRTGEQVLSLLLELAAQQAMTLLVVTHSQAIADKADRILYLKNGQINEYQGAL